MRSFTKKISPVLILLFLMILSNSRPVLFSNYLSPNSNIQRNSTLTHDHSIQEPKFPKHMHAFDVWALQDFDMLLDLYAKSQGLESYLPILEEWKNKNYTIVHIACGQNAPVVYYLQTQGINAFGIDPAIIKGSAPYLIEETAQNLSKALKAKGIDQVDVFISRNFLGSDYDDYMVTDTKKNITEEIAFQMGQLLTESGIFLLRSNHSIDAINETFYALEEFAKLLQAFDKNRISLWPILDSDHHFTVTGMGLYLGKRGKLGLNNLDAYIQYIQKNIITPFQHQKALPQPQWTSIAAEISL